MPNLAEVDAARATRSYLVADVDVHVDAPVTVIDVLDRMLARAVTLPSGTHPSTSITVEGGGADDWRIDASSPEASRTLERHRPSPEVAGAVVSTMIADAAPLSTMPTLRAMVVAHEGRALAILGDDWKSGVVLASHLHSRGWSIVSGLHSFVDQRTLQIRPFPKMLFATSQQLSVLPIAYRQAVEASPWYVRRDGIAFYAVNPELAHGPASWCGGAELAGAIRLDAGAKNGAVRPASCEILDVLAPYAERIDARCGVLAYSDPVTSTDAVERWFAAST